MNDTDAARIMDRLAAAWPDKELPDETLLLWNEELEPLAFSPAYAAARQLTREAKFFPHLSEYLDAYREHTRRQSRPNLGADPDACPECDRGWITVAAGNPPTVRPCGRCNPAGYEQWRCGTYRRIEGQDRAAS